MISKPKFKFGQEVEVIETGKTGIIREVNPPDRGMYIQHLSNEDIEELILYKVEMNEDGSVYLFPETSLKAI